MALQVRIQDLKKSTGISVPWSTGLQELDLQADAWLYRIPHPENHLLVEYAITPISQLTWQDLWVVTIITIEFPGIIGRTAKFLGDLGINIIFMNTCTIEQSQYHSMRLLIDCARYRSNVDKDHEQRRSNPNAMLSQLKRLLVVEFIADIAPPPYPSIAIERCLAFWSLYQECIKAFSIPPGRRLTVRDGVVTLPEMELISDGSPAQILINVDQDAGLVRLFPFHPNSGIVALSLSTANKPGAIAAVASCLGKGGFNILASKAWTSDENRRTSLWLLLQDLRSRPASQEDAKVRSDASSLLISADTLKAFQLTIDSDHS